MKGAQAPFNKTPPSPNNYLLKAGNTKFGGGDKGDEVKTTKSKQYQLKSHRFKIDKIPPTKYIVFSDTYSLHLWKQTVRGGQLS